MAEKKKIDMDAIANELTRGGHRGQSIEWVGDPEKLSDIFTRMGKAVLEIAKTGLSREEKERLVDEKTKEMMKELEEAGIQCETTPVFGTWPLNPDSYD